MWKNVARASERYGCSLDWSGFNLEPTPSARDAPFGREVLDADKKKVRQSKSVSTSRPLAATFRFDSASSQDTTLNPKKGSFRESAASRKFSFFQ
jgi:hypothetical protein